MSDSSLVHELTEAEAMVLIKMALRKVPDGVLKDMRGRVDRAQLANEIAAQTILKHFGLAKHRIVRGRGAPAHGHCPDPERRQNGGTELLSQHE